MDLQPWMAQLGLGTAAVVLFLTVGRSYINYIGKQLAEARGQHREELKRLSDLWEARLAAETKRGDSWETAANRYEQANRESVQQVRELSAVTQTAVALLQAIRDAQGR